MLKLRLWLLILVSLGFWSWNVPSVCLGGFFSLGLGVLGAFGLVWGLLARILVLLEALFCLLMITCVCGRGAELCQTQGTAERENCKTVFGVSVSICTAEGSPAFGSVTVLFLVLVLLLV